MPLDKCFKAIETYLNLFSVAMIASILAMMPKAKQGKGKGYTNLPCHKSKFKFGVRNNVSLKINLVNLATHTLEVKKITTLLIYSEDLNNKYLNKGNIWILNFF